MPAYGLPTAALVAAVKSPVCRIPPHCAHAAGMNFLILDTSLDTHQDGHPLISALIRNQDTPQPQAGTPLGALIPFYVFRTPFPETKKSRSHPLAQGE